MILLPNYDCPTAIDLFAGVGGMSLGFEQAGFDILAAIEIDYIHSDYHARNFPFTKVFCNDVKDAKGDWIIDRVGIDPASPFKVDVVFGGSPCQGFSVQGNRDPNDLRSKLVHEFIRLVFELNARYFVFENVKGLTQGNCKEILENEIIKGFQDIGYEVRLPYKVLKASDYGVPQERERLFLLGWKKGEKPIDYPIPDNIKPITVAEAIGDLPEIEYFPELLKRDFVMCRSEDYGNPSNYAKSLRYECNIHQNDLKYSEQRIRRVLEEYDPNLLTSSLRTIHNEEPIKRFTDTPPGQREPISRFYRLDPNKPARTLLAGTDNDKGSHTAPRPIHPYKPRCITVREAARLHSYPDWFQFHPTKWHGFRQVGNSVPPMMARAIAKEIVKQL